jgi:type IV pilus assembly protein PilF
MIHINSKIGFSESPLQKPNRIIARGISMKTTPICTMFCTLLIFFLFSCATSKDDIIQKDKAEALRKLGEAYMAENKTAPAFRKLKEAEKIDPDDPYTQFDLGIFYFNKKKYDLAIKRYQRCMELKPDFASVRNNIGLAYLQKGDYDKAIENFKELTDNYVYATPHYPLANMGQAYYYKNDFQLAEKYLKEALDLEPKFVVAIHWLGRTQLAMGKTSEAIQNLEKAIQMNASVPEIYFDLGKAYKAMGLIKKSKNSFQRVIDLNPEGVLAAQAKHEINH